MGLLSCDAKDEGEPAVCRSGMMAGQPTERHPVPGSPACGVEAAGEMEVGPLKH